MGRIALHNDIKPISEFRAHATMLLKQVNRTRRPLIITQRGRSAAVLLAVDEYEALLTKIELLADLALARDDIRKGRVFGTDQVRDILRGKT